MHEHSAGHQVLQEGRQNQKGSHHSVAAQNFNIQESSAHCARIV
jgi:hypothetical protein